MRAARGSPRGPGGLDQTADPAAPSASLKRVVTPEQARAIGSSGRDVLIEAGAGTGKTGVMVERYCRLLCEEGVSPGAILAFTFTDKAAAELRQRIRVELTGRAEAGSAAAGAALSEVGNAWVTTIHGFCNRLLASHPVAAGVDPSFRVLDAPETERAASEAFEDALGEFLSDRDESREQTVAAFEIEGLGALIRSAHAELRSRGLDPPRLPETAATDLEAAIDAAAAAAERTLEALRGGDPKRERLEEALAKLTNNAAEPLSLDQLDALGTDSKAGQIAAYKEAIEKAIRASAEAGEGGVTYRHLGTLLELFGSRFEAAKERRSGLDFEDLQILAARLLGRGEIGAAYRSRFSHLMVDEFQDTNRLQLGLIEALRGPRTELMMVGDELQSIYGFRHADLEVFRQQRRAIEARSDAETMALSGNFRSRPELIGAINALGGVLLGDSFHPLRVGTLPHGEIAPPDQPPVEVLLTARDGWDGEGLDLEPTIDGRTPINCLAEARFLAARLAALVEAGVRRSEIVVLLRAFTHLDAYEDSLQRAGLRPYVLGGRGYWSQQQVADVCALLGAIANPLDDKAVFSALACPACGLSPDTLWLLRAAAGHRRHVWPAAETACGLGEAELAEPDHLNQIPAPELALLCRFTACLAKLRGRAPRLPLAGLVEAAVTETGYDLAVLIGSDGEARYANVRKLMRLASEFESREGRDLRGLLDYLAARAEGGAEAQAATAAEAHDGVRIMTIHNAKGLEFEVVAVPDLSRSLLAGTRAPILILGREQPTPRVGLQLRRLGTSAVNLYSYEELFEEEKVRDAEEGLRLFHVAATRARERLILSGVIKPEPSTVSKPSTPVIERIATGLSLPRCRDSGVAVAAPEPRPGLSASFDKSEIAVSVNLPSPQRIAELIARRGGRGSPREVGQGPPLLLKRRPPVVSSRPLSYTAIAAHEECPYRFYLERVLGMNANRSGAEGAGGADPAGREERAARGAVVHALLEWSEANEWRQPGAKLARRHGLAAGLEPDRDGGWGHLLDPVGGWLGSSFFADRVRQPANRVHAETPFLLGIGGAVLRGSIDLLVEAVGSSPLVVDYKTDRLGDSDPVKQAGRYQIQRAIYALAVAESRGCAEVEVAYVFLERPERPVISRLDASQIEAGRKRLGGAITQIGEAEFPVAAPSQRSWALCGGCPALGRLCSGPPR